MTSATFDKAILDAVVDSLPADDLAPVRQQAAESFASLGFPDVGQEDWKYTNLKDIAERSMAWLESGAATAPEAPGNESLEAGIKAVVDAHCRVANALQWPLGFAPPLVERRLDRAGWALVDRFVIEVGAVDSEPVLQCNSLRKCAVEVAGHAGAPAEPVPMASFVGSGEPATASANGPGTPPPRPGARH